MSDSKNSQRKIEATPCWNKPRGQQQNYGRMNELYNRFRTICLDMHGHPLARDPSQELNTRIAEKFSELQDEFYNA